MRQVSLLIGEEFPNFLMFDCHPIAAIEAQIRDMQNQRKSMMTRSKGGGDQDEEDDEANGVKENRGKGRVGLDSVGAYDSDIYSGGGKSKFEGYHTSLAVDDAEVNVRRIRQKAFVLTKILLIFSSSKC